VASWWRRRLSYRSHPLGEDSVTGIRKMSIVWVKKVCTGTAMEEILSKLSDQSGTADRRREEVRSDHENPSDTGRRSKHVRAPQTFPAAQVPCKRSTPNKRHPRARSTPTAHPWPTPLATVPESNPSIYTIKLRLPHKNPGINHQSQLCKEYPGMVHWQAVESSVVKRLS
jgi:hypothetical protein